MSAGQRRLLKGEIVRVRKAYSDDEWCYATVEMISDNGKSAALLLENCFVRAGGNGVISGVLPLLIDEGKGTALGLEGTEYEVEVKA
jgi:hypothetical protein